MAFAQWSESHSVYDAQMDGQHRRLVDLLNRLHEAMAGGVVAEVRPPNRLNAGQRTILKRFV
jgi:hemerythrin